MSLDPNWNRWICASIGNYFKTCTQLANKLSAHIEGEPTKELSDYAEVRMTGPKWQGCSAKHWYGEILVNILVRVIKDANDYHKIYRTVGLVESAVPPCIAIKKYGNTINIDDPTVTIGELTIYQVNGRDITTEHYGQVDNQVPLLESTVEVTYRTDLELN